MEKDLCPLPSTVLSEPATIEKCKEDYDGRSTDTLEHPSSWGAQSHTLGKKG